MRKGKTKWTEVMVGTVLEVLHELVLCGEPAHNGFKKQAWISAKESLKETYKIHLEAAQLKTKWSNVC